jgi:hypothetical protein
VPLPRCDHFFTCTDKKKQRRRKEEKKEMRQDDGRIIDQGQKQSSPYLAKLVHKENALF